MSLITELIDPEPKNKSIVGSDGVHKVDHRSMLENTGLQIRFRNRKQGSLLVQREQLQQRITLWCWRQIQVKEVLPEVPCLLRGSFENVTSEGLLACALANEDLKLSFSQYECDLMS